MGIEWQSHLRVIDRESPATSKEIVQFSSQILAPLTRDEIEQALNEGATEPQLWALPQRPISEVYLDFLQWANGGVFSNGRRLFDPVFSTFEVREYLLSYWLPAWLPGGLPWGFDGGGKFYVFDMRLDPRGDDYPIFLVDSGNLSWDDAVCIGDSFVEVIVGSS